MYVNTPATPVFCELNFNSPKGQANHAVSELQQCLLRVMHEGTAVFTEVKTW